MSVGIGFKILEDQNKIIQSTEGIPPAFKAKFNQYIQEVSGLVEKTDLSQLEISRRVSEYQSKITDLMHEHGIKSN